MATTEKQKRVTVFHRHENGILERGKSTLVPQSELWAMFDKCNHEVLQGWPECVVYWDKKAGATYGYAVK